MALLQDEWSNRINAWKQALRRHCYRRLGTLSLEGFVTREQLTAAQAARRRFRPMPAGTRWGMKWEYGWFRARFRLPATARRQRIVLFVNPAAEGLVFANGRELGSVGDGRPHVTLTSRAAAGASFTVLAEFYAGHGPRRCHAGPLAPGEESVPEVTAPQAEVRESTYGIWQEDVYQLLMDVETLDRLRTSIKCNSKRAADIHAGLCDMTLIVDFELPRDEMLKTVRKARKRLKPLLDRKNRAAPPAMYAFGHGHLDVAWLWPLAESERKAARTLSNQLALADEYRGYGFLHSQPQLLQMVKDRYPALYRRAKAAARTGGIIPEGGMWVEADTNITGGESLIRQFMHGKRFIRKEFGRASRLLWLPDVFGYCGALPQIMKGCGVEYFATAKLRWHYQGGTDFPYDTFAWEGIDGSRVMAHVFADYNASTDPAHVHKLWNSRHQKDGARGRLYPFGHGDGGGGPDRDHLEYVRRERDLEGMPRMRLAPPNAFFEDLKRRGMPRARHRGELYYPGHRGVYTSQARTKRGNRKAEIALRETEMWGAFASAIAGYRYPAVLMDRHWKRLLCNQFHDILPGSSIGRVYEEAEEDYRRIISICSEVTRKATGRLSRRRADTIAVFNSLSWERNELVPLPPGFSGVTDSNGRDLTCQRIGRRLYVEVAVPSCGWTTLRRSRGRAPLVRDSRRAGRILENEVLRVRFNTRGEIQSIIDKETGRKVISGVANRFCMYKDVPPTFDAWDLYSMYMQQPVQLNERATFERVASGPLAAVLRIRRKLNKSTMTQDIILRRNSRRIDFSTTINWGETHKLLKVSFPVNVRAKEALQEIQFGHIARPNRKARSEDADKFEVCNHRWTALAGRKNGAAVLNDCKYGVSVDGNAINLTLLRAPVAPDMNADKGSQECTYSLYAWNGPFAASDIVREGYELNCPVLAVDGDAGSRSVVAVDAPNIIVETVKPAEDGSGDIIVRLYESMRSASACVLAVDLPVAAAEQTDMLEGRRRKLRMRKDGSCTLTFRPFEIVTVRLRLA
ncbi:MAG: alpha-mannosidase [Chitinivibrionales bacterium]|nr:alpha-mannosidase [Chitinivibrionales bacterium]MBD3395854.1 alpha-mannosidase [Chitinivibrionales bacterium]